MTSYCTVTDSQAIVTISSPEQEIITSFDPPVSIDVTTVPSTNYTNYTHTMSAAINITFAEPITDVQLNDPANDWIFSQQFPSSNPIVHAQCPTLTYAPTSYSPSDTLHIDGNRLYSNFDPVNYGDNSGTCTYRVYFGTGYQLTITDSTGQIFQKVYSSSPNYTVSCGDNCPPGYCKCECVNYPGYCCYDSNGYPLR